VDRGEDLRMRFLQSNFLLPFVAVVLLASSVLGYVMLSSSSCGLIEPSELPEEVSHGPRPAEIRLESINELQRRVDFTIKFPECLPLGFTLKGAYESTALERVEGKNGPYTVNSIVLIYWDKDLTEPVGAGHEREDGALFISIIHVPGATLDDFGPPPPPRAVGGAPEVIIPPGALPGLSEISGNPAIIGPNSVEIFAISEETVYRVNSRNYTTDQLITIIKSMII